MFVDGGTGDIQSLNLTQVGAGARRKSKSFGRETTGGFGTVHVGTGKKKGLGD